MVAALAMRQELLRNAAVGLCVALLLAACAGDPDRYPSLAMRDFERVQGQFAAPPAEAPQPVAPVATEAEIGQLVAKAESAFSEFQAAQPGARQAIDAGRGRASDSLAYTEALLELAQLSSLRSNTALVLGEIDLLAMQASTQFAPEDEIKAAQAQVLEFIAQQDATLNDLERALGS